MSEIPMEYKVMKKKFFKGVQKSLGDDLVAILVYGGSASERIFSGVSDIDFFIILKSLDKLSRPLNEVYGLISEQILEYLENPLFASILDYDIFLEDQLPNADGLNGFSAIRALALSSAEVLVGDNPFAGKDVPKKDLIDGGRRMVQEYLEKLTSTLFIPNFDLPDEEGDGTTLENPEIESEKEFLAVDAVLSSTQAYRMVTENKYINMPDIVLDAETSPIDGMDNELVRNAGLLRQGVEADIDDLYNGAIDFCGQIISMFNTL